MHVGLKQRLIFSDEVAVTSLKQKRFLLAKRAKAIAITVRKRTIEGGKIGKEREGKKYKRKETERKKEKKRETLGFYYLFSCGHSSKFILERIKDSL